MFLYSIQFEDFYQFSCGGFLKSKRIPDEQSRVEIIDILRDNLAYNVAGKLKEQFNMIYLIDQNLNKNF